MARPENLVCSVLLALNMGCQSNTANPVQGMDAETSDMSHQPDAAALDASQVGGQDFDASDATPDVTGLSLDPDAFIRGSLDLSTHWDVRENSAQAWTEDSTITVQTLSDFPEPSTVEHPNAEMEILGRVLMANAWCVSGKIRRTGADWTEFGWQCRSADGGPVVVVSQDDRLRFSIQVSQITEF